MKNIRQGSISMMASGRRCLDEESFEQAERNAINSIHCVARDRAQKQLFYIMGKLSNSEDMLLDIRYCCNRKTNPFDVDKTLQAPYWIELVDGSLLELDLAAEGIVRAKDQVDRIIEWDFTITFNYRYGEL